MRGYSDTKQAMLRSFQAKGTPMKSCMLSTLLILVMCFNMSTVNAQTRELTQTYENTAPSITQHFSIDYPADWIIDDSEWSNGVISMATTEDLFATFSQTGRIDRGQALTLVLLYPDGAPYVTTTDRPIAENLMLFMKELGIYDITTISDEEALSNIQAGFLNEYPAARTEITFGEAEAYLLAFQLEAGFIFTLNATAAGEMDSWGETFTDIAKSIVYDVGTVELGASYRGGISDYAHGFRMRYPEDWVLNETGYDNGVITLATNQDFLEGFARGTAMPEAGDVYMEIMLVPNSRTSVDPSLPMTERLVSFVAMMNLPLFEGVDIREYTSTVILQDQEAARLFAGDNLATMLMFGMEFDTGYVFLLGIGAYNEGVVIEANMKAIAETIRFEANN
jgi:hypothetical protein